MLWFKSCPRCKGDLCQDSDMYGYYINCLQCGHYLTAEEETILRNTIEYRDIEYAKNEPAKTLAKVA